MQEFVNDVLIRGCLFLILPEMFKICLYVILKSLSCIPFRLINKSVLDWFLLMCKNML